MIENARLRKFLLAISLAIIVSLGSGRLATAQAGAYARGLAAFDAKDYHQAAELFTQAEAESPGVTDALLYKAKSSANLSDFVEADKDLRSYLVGHPGSADGLAFLGYVLEREDKPEESLEFYNRAAKIQAPQADDLKIVALDYVLLNDIADAVKLLEKCTARQSSNRDCWYYLGRAYFTDGRFREAKPAFEKALVLNPHDSKAEDYLGLILESENRKPEAIQAYKTSIAWQKESSHPSEHPYIHLAMLYDAQGASEQAIEPLLEGLKINSQSALLYDRLGQVYLHLKRYEEAREQLEKALKLDPRNASAHFQLGRAYQRLGLHEEAKTEFAKAQELFGTKQGPTN
jgi:tetratricopeptide (TPR) repeat protein